MPVAFRTYAAQKGFSPDYMRVHDFLVRINRGELSSPNFPWGRWEWMFCLAHIFDTEHLDRIGLWEENGELVALASYESELGEAWFCVDPRYAFLKEDMLRYASRALEKDGKFRALIPDSDAAFQAVAARMGFFPTQEHEALAALPLDEPLLEHSLPEGFSLVSLAEDYDLKRYNRVLHRGFGHEGEAPEDEQTLKERAHELSGPHSELSLKIAVKAPNGDFAAYCGMWHLPGAADALVEPVATDPAYRRMGLARAAVLSACARCALRGAKVAYVGSLLQFYYELGFRPLPRETWWELRA